MCLDTLPLPLPQLSRFPMPDVMGDASVNIFFLNCGVLVDEELHKSNVFDVEYGINCGDFFDSDDGNET